jgi:predicted nucleic acid-binding protein
VILPTSYMLDTNVFDDVLDGRLALAAFAGHRILVIGVQWDELSRAKEPRRAALLATFHRINPDVELAASFVWDIEGAGWDQAEWNDGTGTFEQMLSRLQALDHRSKNSANQLRDVLIAETAIKHGAILVSGDKNLRQVVIEFGGKAIDRP